MFDWVVKFDLGGWKQCLVLCMNLVVIFGEGMFDFFDYVCNGIVMVGQLMFDFGRFVCVLYCGLWCEIFVNIYSMGYKVLGIMVLVGFFIGIVLSYLLVNQLCVFGVSIFIVNILGMVIICELGLVLVVILVVG